MPRCSARCVWPTLGAVLQKLHLLSSLASLTLSASPCRQLIINHLLWKQYCWTSSSFKVFPLLRSHFQINTLQCFTSSPMETTALMLWCFSYGCTQFGIIFSLPGNNNHYACVLSWALPLHCLQFCLSHCHRHDFPYLLSRPSIDCQTRIGRSG